MDINETQHLMNPCSTSYFLGRDILEGILCIDISRLLTLLCLTPSALTKCLLNTDRHGASPILLGSIFQYLTTSPVNTFFLMSILNIAQLCAVPMQPGLSYQVGVQSLLHQMDLSEGFYTRFIR